MSLATQSCPQKIARALQHRPRILFLDEPTAGLDPFARAGRGDHVQFLGRGIVTMGILFTAVFSGVEIIWDRCRPTRR